MTTTPTTDPMMPVDDHVSDEWARLAQDAYRLGLTDAGHRFSAAAALYRGRRMPAARFHALQDEYREWLNAGFPGFAHETLHARGCK